jgi:hypothetical protein
MVSARSMKGRPVETLDGHIGRVEDLYFETTAWKVRYLVVKTGERLLGRKVLILPEAVAEGWHGESGVPVNLTKNEIRSSPDIDTARPVSQVAGQLLYSHYAWPPYWSIGIAPPASGVISAAEQLVELPAVGAGCAGSHLCRVEDVLGYKLFAKCGEAGRLEDLVIHEDDAEVR